MTYDGIKTKQDPAQAIGLAQHAPEYPNAFAKNNALTGVGETRQVFENVMLKMEKGQKHLQSLIDDTMPGGPVERTIEYVAPFDRCDREQDYETAWKFFEEKYGDTQ